jgi:DNA-binding MarR family transcriptional regulator
MQLDVPTTMIEDISRKPSLPQVLHDWTEIFMHRSFRDFKRFMDESDLSPSQAGTLMRLYHRNTSGVSEIGVALGITNPAASQLVERLVQQGLLQRTEDPNDRRVKLVTLTQSGKALIERGIEARRRWMEELTDTLSPEEQQMISGALILLTDAARKLEIEPTQPLKE